MDRLPAVKKMILRNEIYKILLSGKNKPITFEDLAKKLNKKKENNLLLIGIAINKNNIKQILEGLNLSDYVFKNGYIYNKYSYRNPEIAKSALIEIMKIRENKKLNEATALKELESLGVFGINSTYLSKMFCDDDIYKYNFAGYITLKNIDEHKQEEKQQEQDNNETE